MKPWINAVFTVVVLIVGLSFAGGCLYGCYWVAKQASYSFFYEDMVIKTIHQTVKPEYLK